MKRDAFRAKIDAELRAMGYRPGSWFWQNAPARLIMILNGEPREVPIRANMAKVALARLLGKLEGWAEVYVSRTLEPVKKVFHGASARQIDLEDAIAGAAA